MRNFSSINVFKKNLLKFNRPEPNFTYNIHDTERLKLLRKLRLRLSHLGDHKFRHYFQTVYVIYVLVVRKLKKQPKSSFSTLIIIVRAKPSFK